jgi:hypothetical protein
MQRGLNLLLVSTFLLAMTACLPEPPAYPPWGLADLRWLGAADISSPATDILAAYSRSTSLSVDVRVDLLDINPGDTYFIVLSLWDDRAFDRVPLRIRVAANGAVLTTGQGDGRPVIWPRVVQNFDLDTVTFSVNRALIGAHYHFTLASYDSDPLEAVDQTPDIRSDGLPPVQRAPLLLEFWDGFSTATPAQALRSWDGAHTGPLGDRHGLKHILDGAWRNHIPLALLDIKTPASLAALSYLNETWQLQLMYAQGYMILPDVAFPFPQSMALSSSRSSAAGFDLPNSQFTYSASADLVPGYAAQFLALPDASHLARSGGMRLIPMPAGPAAQVTQAGPTLDIRRALVAAALSPDPGDLVVLGGNLADSTWGDPNMGLPTFAWIAAHPWIQPLGAGDLLTFPVTMAYWLPARPASSAPALLAGLKAAPENAITRSARQTYLTLTAPSADPKLAALQANYIGQVNELLAAAAWAKNPSSRMDCSVELDGDGQPECIYSNQKYFALLDLDGARLKYLFSLAADGPHQLVGPSSQFAVGLSDPSEWHLERGEASDPSVIPGAFADEPGTWTTYRLADRSNGLTIVSPDGLSLKTYQLIENGLEVRYQVPGSISTRVPLAVDPDRFYAGPTEYRSDFGPHSWSWSLVNGPTVNVLSDALMTGQGFNSSFPFLFMPEDPNLDYPLGHYYPFPLSVASLTGQGRFWVQITTNPDK